jgi:hypothetical protein
MPDETDQVRLEAETLAHTRERTFEEWLRGHSATDLGGVWTLNNVLRVAFNAGFTACWVEHLAYAREQQPQQPAADGA